MDSTTLPCWIDYQFPFLEMISNNFCMSNKIILFLLINSHPFVDVLEKMYLHNYNLILILI